MRQCAWDHEPTTLRLEFAIDARWESDLDQICKPRLATWGTKCFRAGAPKVCRLFVTVSYAGGAGWGRARRIRKRDCTAWFAHTSRASSGGSAHRTPPPHAPRGDPFGQHSRTNNPGVVIFRAPWDGQPQHPMDRCRKGFPTTVPAGRGGRGIVTRRAKRDTSPIVAPSPTPPSMQSRPGAASLARGRASKAGDPSHFAPGWAPRKRRADLRLRRKTGPAGVWWGVGV